MINIKICGITQVDQAAQISRLRINSIGCIIAADSPRSVTLDRAKEIFDACSSSVTKVLVCVNETSEDVHQYMKYTGAQVVQLHGEETPEYCSEIQFPLIKAIPISNDVDIKQIEPYIPISIGILCDASDPKLRGGTGKTIPWEKVAELSLHCKSLILSGGISPDNIQDALRQSHCENIDVNSGVEKEPGIKDLEKINKLIRNIKEYELKNKESS